MEKRGKTKNSHFKNDFVRAVGIEWSNKSGGYEVWPSSIYHGMHDELDGRVVTKVYQDMTYPMSDYFISSGHNCYLTGNQIGGKGSLAIIAETLTLGKRSLELDCYGPDGRGFCGLLSPKEPGINGGDVKVDHNYAFTKSLKFTEAIVTISQAAFLTSKYPVILNISGDVKYKKWWDHMALVLVKVLGDHLYVPKKLGKPDALKHSPAELVGKVIIRCRLDTVRECEEGEAPHGSSDFLRLIGLDNTKCDHDADEDEPYLPRQKRKYPTSFSVNEDVLTSKNLSKSVGEEGLKKQQLSVWRDTCRNVMRVYPSGLRITSSNFQPWRAWMLGAQMVCLNWQHFDDAVRTNLAFFRANGACGYVLKPPWLRNPSTKFSEYDDARQRFHNLTIDIYGITTARYTGRVKIGLQFWGLREHFQTFHDVDKPSQVAVANVDVRRCQQATKFDYKSVKCEMCLEVGTIVIMVKMDNVTEYALIPTNDLRTGRHLIQLTTRKMRVSDQLLRNNYLAVNIQASEVEDGLFTHSYV